MVDIVYVIGLGQYPISSTVTPAVTFHNTVKGDGWKGYNWGYEQPIPEVPMCLYKQQQSRDLVLPLVCNLFWENTMFLVSKELAGEKELEFPC